MAPVYLWISLAMGWGMHSWFFWVGDLHGKWLVVCGVPVIAAAFGFGLAMGGCMHSRDTTQSGASPGFGTEMHDDIRSPRSPATESCDVPVKAIHVTPEHVGGGVLVVLV